MKGIALDGKIFSANLSQEVSSVETKQKLPVIRQLSSADIEAKLREYEMRYGMDSQEFYEKVKRGQLEETDDFADWLGYYEVYLRLKQ